MLVQDAPHGCLFDDDTKFFFNQGAEINDAPTHNPMFIKIRPSVHLVDDPPSLLLAQCSGCPTAVLVFQTIKAFVVKAMHPVAQGLAVHATDVRGLGSGQAILDRGQGQKTTRLIGVLCLLA